MFGRLWQFLKRNKKKLFFGSLALGGAAYAAWQYLLPRLSEHMLLKLQQGMAEAVESEMQEANERSRRERFSHKQKVSDSHARRKLAALRNKLAACFQVEEITKRLQSATSKEDKLAAFKVMGEECFAKAVAAVYTLHLLLLVHRVGFNIVGRELAESPEAPGKVVEVTDADDGGDCHNAAFLQCLDYLQDAGCAKIAAAVRTAVKTSFERNDMGPQAQATVSFLRALLVDVCKEADEALLGADKNERAAFLLLPDSLDSKAPGGKREEVKRLLDEARDYLDSPQFVQVFQATCTQSMALVAESLAAELRSSGPWPLAKLNTPLAKLFSQVLADDVCSDEPEPEVPEGAQAAAAAPRSVGAALVSGFATEPRVEELCHSLYFQGE